MDNLTFRYSILLVEGLNVTPQSSFPAFILILIIYIFILLFNTGMMIQISVEKSLHQPMYILFCNLTLNDLLGSTVLLPHLLKDILTDPSKRYITYVECVIQAYFTHLNGIASHTVIMTMAFDRYVAICNPLRYSTIMSNNMVVKLSAGAWGAAAVLSGILIGLSVRLSHCRYVIQNHFCDNASLFKLSCENIVINNVYGLAFTVVLLVSSIGSVALTYFRIVMVCIKSKNKATNSKAIKTCTTHLTVYLITFVSGCVVVFLHRFPVYAETRKLGSVMLHIIPPSLNPIIYGIQAKEIRNKIFKLFRRKVNTK
ncbi:olfactory receptor 146-like [Puntigrus tetrazona]|uniref:olfactory receptor 146-like n=1 Tax=Puntigrus tetrazona TaxID=1606681 RepID=UPI001C890FF9|nr:olfactory receptor 146-like [Puntigrus tetrazona]